jgi:hypothetical protein
VGGVIALAAAAESRGIGEEMRAHLVTVLSACS